MEHAVVRHLALAVAPRWLPGEAIGSRQDFSMGKALIDTALAPVVARAKLLLARADLHLTAFADRARPVYPTSCLSSSSSRGAYGP